MIHLERVYPDVTTTVADYLKLADLLLADQIVGFYVVGSAALGEFVPGRSDLDFVAVVRDDFTHRAIAGLRLLHPLTGAEAAVRSMARRRSPLTGTPNGVFVRESDLSRPVSQIKPVASHAGFRFANGTAFDVNPVMWKVLSERGLTFRGTEPAELGLDCEPDILEQWNRDNLERYWRAWGRRVSTARTGSLSSQRVRHGIAWMVAWGVLGPPRLHCTIATGEVIGKVRAGEYALATFDHEWHPVIRQGMAYWHGEPVAVSPEDVRRAGAFALAVADAARTV